MDVPCSIDGHTDAVNMSLDPLTALYKEASGSKVTTDIYLPAAPSEQRRYPVGKLAVYSPFRPLRTRSLI